MTFVWFSFGGDSRPLASSVSSVARYCAQPGDRFAVWEEDRNRIQNPWRAKLDALGVVFFRRPACSNLNGSRRAIRGLLQMLLRSDLDGSGGVWKIDSDTLCVGNAWRGKIVPGVTMLGAQHGEHPDAIYGFSRYTHVDLLGELLARENAWQAFGFWPEDRTISCAAKSIGARSIVFPRTPSGTWGPFGYEMESDWAKYAPLHWVTFGNWHLIPGKADKRRRAGEAMEKFLHHKTLYSYAAA